MATHLPESDDKTTPPVKLFGREKPIKEVLGGGKVANVLLWENKTVSAGLLTGITAIWFLFEVVEYNFVTLLCHILITAMLVVFIWSTGAGIFKWNPPKIPDLKKSALEEVGSIVHERFNQFSSTLFNIACGNDPGQFFLTICSLWILSVIGSYATFLNLLFMSFLCMETLPYLYQTYEQDVDYFADRAYRWIKKMWKKFNSKVLGKIPRGPGKEKAQ